MKTYSEQEQIEIINKYHELRETKPIDDSYSGLTDEEAMCVILPSVGFKQTDALFILGRARGTLPDYKKDKDGNVIRIFY